MASGTRKAYFRVAGIGIVILCFFPVGALGQPFGITPSGPGGLGMPQLGAPPLGGVPGMPGGISRPVPGAPRPGIQGGLPGTAPDGNSPAAILPPVEDLANGPDFPELPLEQMQDLGVPPILELADEIVNDVGRSEIPNLFETLAEGRAVRGEIMALSPTDQSLAVTAALNFTMLREETLNALGMRVVTLGVPDGLSTGEALDMLRMADPVGTYEFNHVYDPSASGIDAASGEATTLSATATTTRAQIAIGVLDSGVDYAHPGLTGARIVSANLAHEGPSPATAHGTAIASLLVGTGAVRGALPQATLYVADVFGGQATGGTAATLIRGLSWLAERDVPVITMSLVGPPNRLLETAIETLYARGITVVAPVGNAGPASPIGYPAAYDAVVAVTSVDRSKTVQIDANRGPEVEFAAYGVDVLVATPGNGYSHATGTSFATPLVAARLAAEMRHPDPEVAASVRESLRSGALDLGQSGHDHVYGHGLLDVATTATASVSE